MDEGQEIDPNHEDVCGDRARDDAVFVEVSWKR
jgi:hypothetical protein